MQSLFYIALLAVSGSSNLIGKRMSHQKELSPELRQAELEIPTAPDEAKAKLLYRNRIQRNNGTG